MGWVEHVAYLGEQRNAYEISIGKPEMMRLRCRWEHNIETNHKEMGLL
jgi:hypothetical protein